MDQVHGWATKAQLSEINELRTFIVSVWAAVSFLQNMANSICLDTPLDEKNKAAS